MYLRPRCAFCVVPGQCQIGQVGAGGREEAVPRSIESNIKNARDPKLGPPTLAHPKAGACPYNARTQSIHTRTDGARAHLSMLRSSPQVPPHTPPPRAHTPHPPAHPAHRAAGTLMVPGPHGSSAHEQDSHRRTYSAVAVGGFIRRVFTRTSHRMLRTLHAMLPGGPGRYWGSH